MKKKTTIITLVACVLSLVMAFALVACGDDPEPKPEVTVTAIELLQTAEIATGDTQNVIAKITYSDGTEKKADNSLTWTSDNETVATVTRGVVTAKANGTAKVSASVGSVTSNVCEVSVYELTVEITADGLDADATTAKLNKEETLQLNATVKKDGEAVDNVEIEWSTSNKNIATVDENGLVTGWDDGEATITATRKGGSQKAEFTVTVEWEKPVGYKPMEFAEQNKLHPDAWGYWNAQVNWGQGLADANAQYTSEFIESDENLADDYQYIGMGKATFEFTINEYFKSHTYQIFYRSSDNFTDDEGVQGKLHFNHDYQITLKVISNVAGTIHVNPYDDIRERETGETVEAYNAYLVAQETAGKIKLAKDADNEYVTDEDGVYVTDHDFVLEADIEKEITVIFRHDDCGYIYQTTVYDNMGTALHIQLADLGWDTEAGESRGRTIFSVYDVQFKDLGEADNPVACDETKHADYVAPPPEGEEGETFEAVYTDYNNSGDDLTADSVWAVWYARSDWGMVGVDMDVSLDEDAKSCTLVFNPNGNADNWGVQLRYIPADVEEGQTFKVAFTINTTVAYTIDINGKSIALEVGNNDIEYYWTVGANTAGKWMVNGIINNANYNGEITLVLSNLTWTEFIIAE